MVDYIRHPMLGGYTSLKSNALMPTESKLTGQFLAAERMLAHIRKLQKVKSRIDAGEPHSWKTSSRAKDARRRQLMVSGGTGTSSIYRMRSSSRPTSGRQSRSSLHQRHASFSARSRSLGSTGDDLDDMYDNMRSISAMGYQSRQQAGGVSGISGSLSPPPNIGHALRTGQDGQSGRALLVKATMLALGQKYENAYDLFNTHDYAFTKPPPQAFTPRMLKTNATSRLSELGYHQPPKKRAEKKQTQNSAVPTENKMATRTLEKPTATTSGEKNSQDDLRATNTLMMSDTLMSRIGSRQQQATPSGVPPLNISLDDDHVRWLQEHKLQQQRQQQVAVQAKHSNEFTSARNHSPDVSNQWNTAAMLLSKTRTLREEEELKYLDFLRDVTDDVLARGIFTNKVLKEVFEAHIEKKTGKLNVVKMRELLDSLRHDLGIPKNSDIDGFGYTSLHNFNIATARSTNRDIDPQGSARKTRPPIPPWQQGGQVSSRRGSSPWLLENVPEVLTERSDIDIYHDTPRSFRNKIPESSVYAPKRGNEFQKKEEFGAPTKSKSPRVQNRARSSLAGSDILRSGRSTPAFDGVDSRNTRGGFAGGGRNAPASGGYGGGRRVEDSQDSFAVSSLMSDDYDPDLLLTDRSEFSQKPSEHRRRKESYGDIMSSNDTNITNPVKAADSVKSNKATTAFGKSNETVLQKVSASKSNNLRSGNNSGRESRNSIEGSKNRNVSKSPGSEKSTNSQEGNGWSNVRKSSQSPLRHSPGGKSNASNDWTTSDGNQSVTNKNSRADSRNGTNLAVNKPSTTVGKAGSGPGSAMSQDSRNVKPNPSRRTSVGSNKSVSSIGMKQKKDTVVDYGLDGRVSINRPGSSLSVYSQKSTKKGQQKASPPTVRRNSIKGAITPAKSDENERRDSVSPKIYEKDEKRDSRATEVPSQNELNEADLTMVTQTLPFSAVTTPMQSRRGSVASSKQKTPTNQSTAQSRRNSVNSTRTSSRAQIDDDEIKAKPRRDSAKSEKDYEIDRRPNSDIFDDEIKAKVRKDSAESKKEFEEGGRPKVVSGPFEYIETTEDADTKPFTVEFEADDTLNHTDRHGKEYDHKEKPLRYMQGEDEVHNDRYKARQEEVQSPRPKPRSRLSSNEGDNPLMDTLTAYQTSLEYTVNLDDAPMSDGELATGRKSEASEASTTRSHDPKPRPRPRRGRGRISRDYGPEEGEKLRHDLDTTSDALRSNDKIDHFENIKNKDSRQKVVNNSDESKNSQGKVGDLASRRKESKSSKDDLFENSDERKDSRGKVTDDSLTKKPEGGKLEGGKKERSEREEAEMYSPVRSVVEEMSSRESTLRGEEIIGESSTDDITKTLPTAVPASNRKTNSRNSSRSEVPLSNNNINSRTSSRNSRTQRESPPADDERDNGDSKKVDLKIGQSSVAVEKGGHKSIDEEVGHRSISANVEAYESSESLEISDLDEDEADF